MLQLDQTSHLTIGRFGLKLGISGVIASMGTTSYALAVSGWLALYAIVRDEASWLAADARSSATARHS